MAQTLPGPRRREPDSTSVVDALVKAYGTTDYFTIHSAIDADEGSRALEVG